MCEKVKKVLSAVVAFLVSAGAFLVGFLCKTDRGRVSDSDDKLSDCGDRLKTDEDRLSSDEDRIRECKEVLERARKRTEEGTD